MNWKNSPHSTVRLESNDTEARSVQKNEILLMQKSDREMSSIFNDKIEISTQWTPLTIFRLEFRVRRLILPLETFCDQWSSESKDPL